MNGVQVGNIQGIAYSEQRQKVPIYTFGSTDPKQFLRGNRAIIGRFNGVTLLPDSLILAIVKAISDYMSGKESAGLTLFPKDKYLYGNREELIARYVHIANMIGLPTNGEYWKTKQLTTDKLDIEYDETVPVYLNELPPFDVIIQGMNEYGKKAVKWIYGCEFTDESSFITMQGTTQILESANFVARTASPWREVTD